MARGWLECLLASEDEGIKAALSVYLEHRKLLGAQVTLRSRKPSAVFSELGLC